KCAIVGFFHHSSEAAEKLIEIQNQLKMPEHKLIQSVKTRWHFIFYMLDRIAEQQQDIITSLCLLGKNTLCLSEEELAQIRSISNVLKPFEEATREVSAENYVSISKVIPLVTLLQKTTSNTEQQGNPLAVHLSRQCKRSFQNIEHNYTLTASTLLDIRFEIVVLSDSGNVDNIKGRLLNCKH
ncbi:Zinc finger BED domain-containing protein 4, partial [Acipenser ruthenus]